LSVYDDIGFCKAGDGLNAAVDDLSAFDSLPTYFWNILIWLACPNPPRPNLFNPRACAFAAPRKAYYLNYFTGLRINIDCVECDYETATLLAFDVSIYRFR
jgi:hypothetical protein